MKIQIRGLALSLLVLIMYEIHDRPQKIISFSFHDTENDRKAENESSVRIPPECDRNLEVTAFPCFILWVFFFLKFLFYFCCFFISPTPEGSKKKHLISHRARSSLGLLQSMKLDFS